MNAETFAFFLVIGSFIVLAFFWNRGYTSSSSLDKKKKRGIKKDVR